MLDCVLLLLIVICIILEIDIENQKKEWGEAHFLDLFYLGISKYEQGKWEEAITEFDNSLQQYPNFSDVEFYKTICLKRLELGNYCFNDAPPTVSC